MGQEASLAVVEHVTFHGHGNSSTSAAEELPKLEALRIPPTAFLDTAGPAGKERFGTKVRGTHGACRLSPCLELALF